MSKRERQTKGAKAQTTDERIAERIKLIESQQPQLYAQLEMVQAAIHENNGALRHLRSFVPQPEGAGKEPAQAAQSNGQK